jgi:hypothetical protein
MAFSSYAHFDKYDIPGFFPVDAHGMSSAAVVAPNWELNNYQTKKPTNPSEVRRALAGCVHVLMPSMP